MGYNELIDISLNVDLNGLREALEQRTTEDRVQELLASKVERYVEECFNDLKILDEDRVHDLIANHLSEEGIPDERETRRLIDRELDGRDFITGDDLQAQVGERITNLEHEQDDLDNRVGTLANEVASLTEQVAAQDSALDAQLARIEDLETQMREMLDRNDTALTFFDLIKQAFALLQK